jgi:hypothetical protein
VVDRLFEKQSRTASGAVTLSTSTSSSVSNSAVLPGGRNEMDFVRWMNALDILTAATAVLDQETIEEQNGQLGNDRDKTTTAATTSSSSTRNSRWTGRVEIAIQTRVRELRREEQAIVKRTGVRMTMAAVQAAKAAAATSNKNNPSSSSSKNEGKDGGTEDSVGSSGGGYVVETMGRGSDAKETTSSKASGGSSSATKTNPPLHHP